MSPGTVKTAMLEVHRRLRAIGSELTSFGPEVAAYLTAGKLLRGKLVVLASRLGAKSVPESAIRFAVAIELIHGGALCHDDVVDGSRTRRSRRTLEHAFGTRAAICVGLFLMVRAAESLSAEPAAVRQTVARVVRDVVRGQTDEIADAFDEGVSPAAYLRRAYSKTGALYELAAWLGGRAGRLHGRSMDALASFGADIGLAFQLLDDLRDLVGGPALGRAAGTDILSGVYTLPLLLTFSGRHGSASTLHGLLRARSGPIRLPQCVTLLRANGAFDATASMATSLVERGIAALRALPPSRVRNGLETLAHEIVGQPPEHPTSADGDCQARRTPLRPVIGTLLPAMDTRLASRLAAIAERFRSHLPACAQGPGSWTESASLGTALAAALLELSRRASDRPPGRATGREVASKVRLVTTVDLLMAELFGLLPVLPTRLMRTLTSVLAAQLRDVLSCRDDPDNAQQESALGHLADQVGSVAAGIIAAEAAATLPPEAEGKAR